MRLFGIVVPLLGVLIASCGTATYDVTTTVVSSEFTQDMWVTSPDDGESGEWG